MYLFGFGGAWWLARKRAAAPHAPLKVEQVDDLIFYAAVGVVLGGRLGYVLFYGMDRFVSDPAWLFRINEGGMSFHGGFLGVMAAMWLYARKLSTTLFGLLDFIAPLVPIGLGLGRLGNFIGQELWGRASDAPWAMVFPRDPMALARHPSQLYQALLEGLVLFLVLFLYSRKPRARYAVSGWFALLYGVFRFAVEFVREPDSHIGLMFGWMSRGQQLSLPLMAVGVYLLVLAHRQAVTNLGKR
jgi:phosphatidylglycerol:prolipoprotein diacylglycerol transferase